MNDLTLSFFVSFINFAVIMGVYCVSCFHWWVSFIFWSSGLKNEKAIAVWSSQRKKTLISKGATIMSTTTFVRLVGVSIILASSLVMTEPQRTATSTETTTIISTVFVTRNVSCWIKLCWNADDVLILLKQFLCAKLVNVTGACRRSRGFLIDEPVVLTFDEELNEPVDKTLDSVLHPQFKPSATLGYITSFITFLPNNLLILFDYAEWRWRPWSCYLRQMTTANTVCLRFHPRQTMSFSRRNRTISAQPEIRIRKSTSLISTPFSATLS